MTFEEILPHVDHTLLAATATKGEIEKLCEEAEMYHTASVCVPSSFVKGNSGTSSGTPDLRCRRVPAGKYVEGGEGFRVQAGGP